MKLGRIRTFASDDVGQVARLHHTIFRSGEEHSQDTDLAYRSFFHDVYLGNPWYEERLSSLTYEEADGRITGFLGVMPRSMRIDGRPIRAAISSMFMVDPSSRRSLAALQLMKAFLSTFIYTNTLNLEAPAQNEDLFENGTLDSLSLVDLLAELESEFGFHIPPDQLSARTGGSYWDTSDR